MAPPVAAVLRGRRSTSRRNRKAVQHYTDSNPSTFTTKKPRGSPPEQKSSSPSRGRRRRRTESTTVKEAPPPPPSPPLPPHPRAPSPRPPSPRDTVLSHQVTIAPIFPPPPVLPPSLNGIRQSFRSDPSARVAFGRGLGIPRPVKEPEWTQVRYHDFYHPMDYVQSTETGGPRVVLKQGATPVVRYCTCLAISSDHLAVGDTAGLVSIYSLGSLVLPLALITTTASQREYQEHQTAVGPAKSKYGFRVPDIKSTKPLASQYANAIEALCMLDTKVALSTKEEVEVIHAQTNQVLWTMPLTRGPAVKLDLHSETLACLASFCYTKTVAPCEAETPLMLFQQDDGSVQTSTVVPVNDDKTPLRLGTKCAAMWDRSNANRLVLVSLVYKEDATIPSQELLLVDKHSLAVLHRAAVPIKVMGSKTVSTEAFSQSPLGKFTVVASTRGVRLFETSNLSLLRVYGETVSLHGHGIVWQDCFLVTVNHNTNQDTEDLEHRRNGKYLERPDELRYRHLAKQQDVVDEEEDFLANALVVGVPHAFRQPVELQNTLHFWDAQSDGKHTAFTIAGPPKASGIVTALYASGRLLLSTQQGDCLERVSTLKSEFAGVMYPPGYHVIDDNLEYLEDEDELDIVVHPEEEHEELVSEEEHEVVVDDDDLAEAMRRSVLEIQAKKEELEAQQEMDIISVVDHAYSGVDTSYLPCHPEPYLQQDVYRDEMEEGTSCPLSPSSAQLPEEKHVFVENYLSMLPQTEHVLEVAKNMKKRGLDAPSEVEAVAPPPPIRVIRGKRSRTANLEALIKASINPRLKAYMTSREQWTDGAGSTLRQSDRVAAAMGKQKASNALTMEHVAVQTNGVASKAPAAQISSAARKTDGTESILETPSDLGKDETNVTNQSSLAPQIGAPEGTSIETLESTPMPSVTEVTSTPSTLSSEVATLSTDDASSLHLPASKPAEPDGALDTASASKSAVLSDKAPPVDAAQKAEENDTTSAVSLSSHCDACCGRMVFHVCGKRDLPIDFEAIARAEKEKKEKEKEAKLKARIEKRRLADQKRREAKRKKRQEEEQRKKREEEERRLLEIEEAKMLREEEQQRRNEDHHVKERRRAEILQRLMEAQKEQSIAESQERRPEQVPGPQYVQTNATEIGRRLEYYSDSVDRQPPGQQWAPPPSPAIPLHQSTDNRTDALEALASLANGFVATASPHQQSQSTPFSPYSETSQPLGEANMSRPSYSTAPRSSPNATPSFSTPAGQNYYDNSNYSGQVGSQYSTSRASEYVSSVATNTPANTPSSYTSASYNSHHSSSGAPLSPPPAFASRSLEFGQSPYYDPSAGRSHASSSYNQVPPPAAASFPHKAGHGFGSASHNANGQQIATMAGSPYPADSTTSFRAQVRQGLHSMSSFNGPRDRRESASVTTTNRYDAGCMGNSSSGSANASVTAGSTSVAPSQDESVSYSGIMPHRSLPQRVVPVSVTESHSTHGDDVNNR